MSAAEREKWNGIYASDRQGERFSGPPAAILDWVLPLLPPAARVLDLGSGPLRQARPLAAEGHLVLAVDVAEEAFRRAGASPPGIETLVADLDHWRPEPAAFDLVLAVHYLNRELAPRLGAALRPGGYLALEARVALPQPGAGIPAHRLLPGEAFRLHADLRLLRFEEKADKDEGLGRYLFRRSR
ncbi:MAG: class I SAM-dependent methyltransferase [Planctomycetes bacterium]|nr:class I SAM-dependent methyltransferase [Planctomycetota bacterium]